MKNLIKSSIFEEKYKNDDVIGNVINEIDHFDFRSLPTDLTLDYIASKYLKIDLYRCSLSKNMTKILTDPNYFFELNDIDFSNEKNCLICLFRILLFFENEYNIKK